MIGAAPNPALYGRVWTLRSLERNVLHDRQTCLTWCQDVGLLPTQKRCPRCNSDMRVTNTREESRGDVTCIGKKFRCQKKNFVDRVPPHDCEVSMAKGSWFSLAHLPMELIVQLTYMMAHGSSYDEIFREVRDPDQDDITLSQETVADWYTYFREVIVLAMHDRIQARGRIGGPGRVVEIDEAKIGHRKYNRGRLVDGHWILGMVDRDSGEIRVEILANNDRSAAAMLPLIQQHVEPGSVIHTDEWRAYAGLNALNYAHQTVNHTYNFVDPTTGAHTQTIESNWRPMKRRLCRGGVRTGDNDHLDLHLCEYLWRRQLEHEGDDPFVHIIGDICRVYPVH